MSGPEQPAGAGVGRRAALAACGLLGLIVLTYLVAGGLSAATSGLAVVLALLGFVALGLLARYADQEHEFEPSAPGWASDAITKED